MEQRPAIVSPDTVVRAYIRLAETEDFNASPIASAEKTAPKPTVKAPFITPNEISFASSVEVTISSGTDGADIYYTTDGTTPTTESTKYTGAFTLTESAVVNAVAVKDEYENSSVVSASFTKKNGISGNSGSSHRPSTPGTTTEANSFGMVSAPTSSSEKPFILKLFLSGE